MAVPACVKRLDDLGWACYTLGWEPEDVIAMLYAIDLATNRTPAQVMRGSVALYPESGSMLETAGTGTVPPRGPCSTLNAQQGQARKGERR